MPRAPFSALFNLVLGLAAGLSGMAMALWAAIATIKIERGFDVAMWAAQRFPVAQDKTPVEFGNQVVNNVGTIAVVGVVLFLTGLGMLRSARTAARPAGESDDGSADLKLKTPCPRAGEALEGRIALRKAVPGQAFTVVLRCFRRKSRRVGGQSATMDSSRDEYTSTVHHEELKVRVVRDAAGWFLPFRFDIPITAPASEGTGLRDLRWRLELTRDDAWVSFGNGFDLVVAAAGPDRIAAYEASLPADVEKDVQELGRAFGKFNRDLSPYQREQLRKLSPAEREQARTMLGAVGKVGSGIQKALLVFIASIFAIVTLMFAIAWLVAPERIPQ